MIAVGIIYQIFTYRFREIEYIRAFCGFNVSQNVYITLECEMDFRKLRLELVIVLTAALTIQATPDTENVKFPDDFLIGASTSAYQVEGASNIDGKGPSIRDSQNSIKQIGAVTADSYYFYEEDIKAIKSIGVSG